MGKGLPELINIGHGSGGSMTRDLVRNLFAEAFDNKYLDGMCDSSVISMESDHLAYTTDSYVVDPLFFPGGDIGKLAICGTVNDLSVAGAVPKYISAGFIIEEGLSTDILKRIVDSMAAEAINSGVIVVTGDTKVVNHGKCDKLFINTSGIGLVASDRLHISSGSTVKTGDKIIINGPVGDHAMAILAARSDIEIETDVKSDCVALNSLISEVTTSPGAIRFMRDATRGGLATVLVELAESTGFGVKLLEDKIPVSDSVSGICEILGFDPLYLANEGKVVMVVDPGHSERILGIMQANRSGRYASEIGEIGDADKRLVTLKTTIGGSRVIDMLAADQLPRIC